MSTIRKIKVCLNIKPGELTCPNPEIIWGSNPNILKNCVFKDGCIEVSILEDDLGKLKGKCIPYTIICDNCGNCPPKDGEACFCDNGDDCSNCQNCVTGVCVDKCPGKICKPDGVCVDCMDGTCPGNQQCIDGKCQCPPNKPYQDGNGNCYGCKSDTECPPCYKCDGSGNCVPRDCGNLACDPTLDRCVECVDSTKCKPNEVCINNKCECGPGYERDPLTGLCVVKPECKTKEQCGPCKHCIDGECVDIKCPDGFKCVDDNCVPDPCGSKPCEDGTDCGEDCGCKDKVCTECASLSCEECAKSLGCVCNPVTGACEKKVTCDDEPCVTKYDCSQDCGCDQSECKDCANYSCEDCGKVPGCKCNPVTKQCEGDGDRGCKDTFTLAPDKCDATLTAKLTKTQPCACETLTAKLAIAYLDRGKSTLSIRKGNAEFDSLLPLLSPESKNNSETENLVTSATLKIVLTALDGTGKVVKTNTVTKSLNSLGEKSLVGPTVITGLDAIQLEKISTVNYKVSLTDVVFKDNKCTYGDQELINENFEPYKGTDSVTFTNTNPDGLVERFTQLESEDFRDPLFIWFRSKDNSFASTDIIRKQYISIANGVYVDKLTLDNGFLPKFDYRVETDCSCNEGVSLEDVVICEDINLPVKLTQCNTRLEFTDDIKLCDLSNTNIYGYVGKGIIKPNTFADVQYASVAFDLLINGIKKSTFTAGADKVLARPTLDKESVKGLIIDNGTEPITSVSLVVAVDGVTKCEAKKEFPEVAIAFPIVTTTCKESSSEVIVKFVASPNSPITKVVYNEGNYPVSNNVVNITVPKDGTYIFEIHFASGCASGCVKEWEQKIVCCDQKSINFVAAVNSVTPISEITITKTEGTTFFLTRKGFGSFASITTDYGEIDSNKNLFLTFDQVTGINGEKTVTVTISEGGCIKTATLKITRLPLEFTISPSQCGEGTITLTGMAGYTYNITGVASGFSSGSLPESGTVTISTNNGASTTKNYTLTTYNTFPTNLTLGYTKLSSPTVTGIVIHDGSSCDDTLKLNLQLAGTGLTESTIVTYKIGLGGDLVEAVLVKDSLGNFILSMDRPAGTSANIILTKVSNGTPCDTVLNISQNITISNISSIAVNTPTCNTSTNLFSVVLTLDPAFNISTDNVVFDPALPSGVIYTNATKTISGIPEDSDLTFDAAIVFNGIQQCFTIINIQTGSCDCASRPISINANPVICKKTTGGSSNATLNRVLSASTEFTLSSGSNLTFTSNLSSDIKVYLSKGIGVLNEFQLVPGAGANDLNYNTLNGKLSVNVFEVPTTFFTAINYNDLQLVIRVAAKDAFCATEFTRPINVNNLDSIATSDLSYELYYNQSAAVYFTGDFNDYSSTIPANLEGVLYAKIVSSTTVPTPAEIIWNTKAYQSPSLIPVYDQTYTVNGADINAGFIFEVFDSTGLPITNLVITITKRFGDGSCEAIIKNLLVTNVGGNFVTITRSGTPVIAPQELCTFGASEVFGHDYIGPEIVSAHEWKYNNTVIGNGSTVNFAPPSYTADNVNKDLAVQLTLGNGEILNGFVLVRVKPSITPTFSLITTPVATGYMGGVYTLPASTNGVTGSWFPATLDTTTPTSTAQKTSVFTPTGGQCALPYAYELIVNTPAPVSTPDITISGPSSGCSEVVLSIDLQNSTQYFVSTSLAALSACPPALTPLVASTYTATASGTYYFKSTDGSTCSSPKSFTVVVTAPSAIEPSVAFPSSFVYGSSYTLPNPVSTSSGNVLGAWEDIAMTPVTTVDSTTLGPGFYRFVPTAGQCKLPLDYTPTINCPTGLGYTQSESLGSFNFTLQTPFDTIAWEVRQSSTVIASGSSTTILKDATNFPNAGETYQIYITASIGVSTCLIESFFGNYCRCSSPSCTSIQPCYQSLYKDSAYTQLISGGTTVLTNWELDTESPFDSFICKVYTLSNSNSASGIIQEFCNISPFFNYTVTVATSGTLNIDGVNIVRGASETQAAFVNRVNVTYPGALIAATAGSDIFKFNVKLYTTTNTIDSNNQTWSTTSAGGHSESCVSNSCSSLCSNTSFTDTYTYDEGLSYATNVAAMIALYNAATITINSITEYPNNLLTAEC